MLETLLSDFLFNFKLTLLSGKGASKALWIAIRTPALGDNKPTYSDWFTFKTSLS